VQGDPDAGIERALLAEALMVKT